MKIFELVSEDRELGPSLRDQGYEFDYVTIYRAVLATETTFKSKDYVTRSIKFAKEHAEHIAAVEEEPAHVLRAIVRSSDVYSAYNPGEYFYDGPEAKGKVIYIAPQELDEDLKWAIGSNINHATQLTRKDLENPETDLVWINIKDLYNQTSKNQRLDINDPDGGKIGLSGRVQRAKEHWLEDGFMDPSYIVWNRYENVFNFSDGRHRLVAAHQLGEKWAPVIAANKETAEKLRELVKTR